MREVNIKIIEEVKKFVDDVSTNKVLLNEFRNKDKNFTRLRKLPFNKLVLFIAHLCKKTLSVELEQFFEQMGGRMPCSVSAFCQQRTKLKADFFRRWNEVLCSGFYRIGGEEVNRYKGYRLVAGDGSCVALANTKELKQYFGGQNNQHNYYVQAKAYLCYDVLNELIVHSWLNPYRCSELSTAYKSINALEEDMLMIYDRNFSNFKIIAWHRCRQKEIKFIIRAKESLNIIKSFLASGAESTIVSLKPNAATVKDMNQMGCHMDRSTRVEVRLVRVELEDKVEVLITNLWQEEGFDNWEFKGLYFMRWGVETNIGFQKNVEQLESFSGLSVGCVMQDFYATIFMANLHSVLIKEAQQSIDQKGQDGVWKYPMKINKNKSFGHLKIYLVVLFMTGDIGSILERLRDIFIKDLVPVRKGRTFPRVRKNKRTRSKYRTYTNFKPSY